jgi:c-di-GMP-binding flagellar brake protein YcgR
MSQPNPIAAQAETSLALERRAYVRIATDRTVRCTAADRCREPGWAGRLRDISQGGCGLLLQHRFRPGTVLLVDLHEAEGDTRRSIRAQVIHATAFLADGTPCWLLGCRFDKPLSEAEVTALR